MAAPGSVRVEGLSELNRDLGRLNRKIQREFQAEIRYKLAEPVAKEIRRLAAEKEWGPRVVPGVRAGSSLGGAVVRQQRRKTTGQHPGFGSLQMIEAFLPGLENEEEATVRRTAQFIDRLTAETGFGTLGSFAAHANPTD